MNDCAPMPDASRGRTREGLSEYDLRIAYELDQAIFDQHEPAPGLIGMHAWVDGEYDRIRSSALTVALMTGAVAPHHARHLAVGRRLLDFIARCLENEEQLTTMFRAKAHNDRRRK